MGDNVVLFHSTHGNLAGSGTAIDVTSIGLGRKAMALQTGIDGSTLLSIYPTYLIVPENKRVIAEQFISGALFPATQDTIIPQSLSRLQVISEPRLDVGVTFNGTTYSGSSTAWYLASTPAQIDTIEVAYLEGNRGVYTETRVGFDVDGIEVKARLDVGAKVIDWRGFYKNTGA